MLPFGELQQLRQTRIGQAVCAGNAVARLDHDTDVG